MKRKSLKMATFLLSSTLIFTGCANQQGAGGTNLGNNQQDTRAFDIQNNGGVRGNGTRNMGLNNTFGTTNGTMDNGWFRGLGNGNGNNNQNMGISSMLQSQLGQTGTQGAKVLVLGDTVIVGLRINGGTMQGTSINRGATGANRIGVGTNGNGMLDNNRNNLGIGLGNNNRNDEDELFDLGDNERNDDRFGIDTNNRNGRNGIFGLGRNNRNNGDELFDVGDNERNDDRFGIDTNNRNNDGMFGLGNNNNNNRGGMFGYNNDGSTRNFGRGTNRLGFGMNTAGNGTVGMNTAGNAYNNPINLLQSQLGQGVNILTVTDDKALRAMDRLKINMMTYRPSDLASITSDLKLVLSKAKSTNQMAGTVGNRTGTRTDITGDTDMGTAPRGMNRAVTPTR